MWMLIYKEPRPAKVMFKVRNSVDAIEHNPRPWWEVWDCDDDGKPLTPKSYIPDPQDLSHPKRWYADDGDTPKRAADTAYNNNVLQYPNMVEYLE